MLYKSLMIPTFDYGDVVYSCATKESLNKLQIVQNRACRVILREGRRANIDQMHKRLKLLKLDDRRELHMQCLCHRNIHNDSKTGLDTFFEQVEHVGRVTRFANNMNLKIKNFRTDKGRQAISYRGPISWNKLDNNLKLCEKFASFKRQLLGRITGIWDNHPV